MAAVRIPPEKKHTNRQVSFSGEFHEFLDSLEKGTVSSFLEQIGRNTKEFRDWKVTKNGR
jgi:hypothetical protein